jgi:hypothetical protein
MQGVWREIVARALQIWEVATRQVVIDDTGMGLWEILESPWPRVVNLRQVSKKELCLSCSTRSTQVYHLETYVKGCDTCALSYQAQKPVPYPAA